MFGLPDFTTAVMIVIPGFWAVYTAAFYILTRSWAQADEEE